MVGVGGLYPCPSVCTSLVVGLFFSFNWKERAVGRKREGEERNNDFVVPLTDAFVGSFLYVPWPEIKPATLAYWDDALTKWANQPGLVVGLCSHATISSLKSDLELQENGDNSWEQISVLLPHRNSSGKESQEENLRQKDYVQSPVCPLILSTKLCFIKQSHEMSMTLATEGVGTFCGIPVADQSILK